MSVNTTTIHQLLDEKGRDVWAIDPDDSVFNAVTEMSIRDVGGLLVLKDKKIVGILTERDYTRNVILKGKTSSETPVCEIMSENVICAMPEHSVSECLEIMTEKRIRHLPVVDNDRLVGMISIGDLVKRIITDQQNAIDKLENVSRT